MTIEVTVKALSEETGFSIDHISRLVARGILPKGRKDGKSRYLPWAESRLILNGHEPGRDWKQRTRAKVKQSDPSPVADKALTWADVL